MCMNVSALLYTWMGQSEKVQVEPIAENGCYWSVLESLFIIQFAITVISIHGTVWATRAEELGFHFLFFH